MISFFLDPLTHKDYLKVLSIPAVLLVLIFAAVLGTKSCVDSQYSAAAVMVATAKGKEQATARELVKANEALRLASADSKAKEVLVLDLQAKLDAKPKPAPHPNIPTSAKSEELRAAGLVSPITGQEAELAWSWKKSAEDLPIVSARLVAAESLIDGQKAQNQALKGELASAYKVMDHQVQLLSDRAEQIRGLELQVSAGLRAQKVGTVEKVIEIGAAAVLGALVGRASK